MTTRSQIRVMPPRRGSGSGHAHRRACPIVLLAVLLSFLPGVVVAQSLLEVDGAVELRSAADSPWLPAAAGDALEVGGALRTFQGGARLDLGDGGVVSVGTDSELVRGPRSYLLVSGRVFVEAEGAIFDLDGPLRVTGAVRLDSDPDAGRRVAVIAGTARATLGARVMNLEPGQQLLIAPGADPEVSAFLEDDPWYRVPVVVAEGQGEVLGFQGTADVQEPGAGWIGAELGASFTPGMRARTGADSWLELQFEGDNLVRLQADTVAELQTLATYEDGMRRTVLALEQGTLWAVVADGESFEIRTPDLVAGVRGTTFRLDAATGDAPARLKVFEGEVTAEAGGDIVVVAAGQQFDTVTGLTTLVPDGLDDFNLERDLIVSLVPTELVLSELPTQFVGAELDLSGRVIPADATVTVRVAGNTYDTAAAGDFQLTVSLTPGFNLLEVRAAAEGATTVTKIRPLIRLDAEPWLALVTERQQDQLIVRGVTGPGAELQFTLAGAGSSRITADGHGRFSASLPLPSTEIGDLTVVVTDRLGHSLQRRIPANTF